MPMPTSTLDSDQELAASVLSGWLFAEIVVSGVLGGWVCALPGTRSAKI